MTAYSLFSQTDPHGYGGFGGLTPDTSGYTLGMQFTLATDAALTGIWFWSETGATVLPTSCGIFRVSDHALVASITSGLTWSGAAGSGWVKATFPGTTTLLGGVAYKVAVAIGNGVDWYSATSHFWDTGPGASGLTSGIITAPNNAGADGGQDSYDNSVSGLGYPATSFLATSYWVDVEVTTASSGPSASGLLLASGFPL